MWYQDILSFVLVLLLLSLMGSALQQKLQRDYQSWQSTVDLWQNTLQQAESLVLQRETAISEFRLLQQHQHQLQAVSLQASDWLFFIQNFAADMADSVWLTRAEKVQHKVTLTGFSPGLDDIDQFRQRLSQYPLFQSVSPGTIERQSDGYLLFTLHALVRSVKISSVKISSEKVSGQKVSSKKVSGEKVNNVKMPGAKMSGIEMSGIEIAGVVASD